jgi:hypothetical protein
MLLRLLWPPEGDVLMMAREVLEAPMIGRDGRVGAWWKARMRYAAGAGRGIAAGQSQHQMDVPWVDARIAATRQCRDRIGE